MAMRTETTGRRIVGAASLRAEPRPQSQSLREARLASNQRHLTTSSQAQCHTRELRSDAGLRESGRSAELGSEKTPTPTSGAVRRAARPHLARHRLHFSCIAGHNSEAIEAMSLALAIKEREAMKIGDRYPTFDNEQTLWRRPDSWCDDERPSPHEGVTARRPSR